MILSLDLYRSRFGVKLAFGLSRDRSDGHVTTCLNAYALYIRCRCYNNAREPFGEGCWSFSSLTSLPVRPTLRANGALRGYHLR